MKTNESVVKIANRYCNSIAAEIRLMPARIAKNVANNDFGGFMYHNLATQGEMLDKYFVEQIKSAGCEAQLNRIVDLCMAARALQDWADMTNGGKNVDQEEINEIISEMLELNTKAQKLLPILFFV